MNTALVLSGGTGTRLGADIPKQYIKVNQRMIISYCLEQLFLNSRIDALRIVAEECWQETLEVCISEYDKEGKFRGFSKPGKSRQLSIWNGLQDMKAYAAEADYVLIHDAARPFLSGQLITDCLDAAAGHDGVLPVLPMKDTVYRSEDGQRISSLLKRDEIYAGQAPEAFLFGSYYEANQKLLPERILKVNGSTEPAILAGLDVVLIPGEEENFKVTTKEDLERMKELVDRV